MAGEPEKTALPEVFDAAQRDPELKHIYANGFGVGLTNADVSVVLQLSGRPIKVLHLSYTLAKTLAEKLGQVVKEFETAIDTKLVTTDKVDEAFKKLQEKKAENVAKQ
ncbi:MAG: hypothetical protein Q7R30_04380 [Acidobacteriota bacterium]|nr:hypothetical protein [Acidobacteriota bacterium]